MSNKTRTLAARLLVTAVAGTLTLGSVTASAAQPAAAPAQPATAQPIIIQPVAPAPAPAEPTSTVTTAGTPSQPIIVVNTNVPVAPSQSTVSPRDSWEVQRVEPQPAPVPVQAAPAPIIPDHIRVDVHPHPMEAPTMAPVDHKRLQLVADTSRARNLMIAGWATLGGTYAFSALTGTIAIDTARNTRMRNYGAWMTIPVAGPFAAAFYTRTATGGLLTTALGVAQGGGLLMALVGGARHRRLKNQLAIAVAPTGDGGGQIGVSGRF